MSKKIERIDPHDTQFNVAQYHKLNAIIDAVNRHEIAFDTQAKNMSILYRHVTGAEELPKPEPDDPFAVGKWFLDGRGYPHEITKRDRQNDAVWSSWHTPPLEIQWYSGVLTPLAGTPETCKLELGDEGKRSWEHGEQPAVVVDLVLDFVGLRCTADDGTIFHVSATRGRFRLVRRPPKGEQ